MPDRNAKKSAQDQMIEGILTLPECLRIGELWIFPSSGLTRGDVEGVFGPEWESRNIPLPFAEGFSISGHVLDPKIVHNEGCGKRYGLMFSCDGILFLKSERSRGRLGLEGVHLLKFPREEGAVSE